MLVDGLPAQRGRTLQAGMRVEIVARDPERPEPPPQPNGKLRLRVLEEDEHLLVLDKPAGMAMHPGPGHGTDTLLNGLVARYAELLELGPERGYGLVHRLDLETSGALVVARSAAAYDGLVEAFRARRVEKEYLALTAGAPDPAEGVVERPIDDKDARTRYQVEAQAGEVARVRCFPETGRTHQLRIHLASLGTPVLHDPRHGHGRDALTGKLYLTRLALHAERLRFPHPVLGAKRVGVEVRWPKALRRAWARAEKLGS